MSVSDYVPKMKYIGMISGCEMRKMLPDGCMMDDGSRCKDFNSCSCKSKRFSEEAMLRFLDKNPKRVKT
jgi:hypothetical protein